MIPSHLQIGIGWQHIKSNVNNPDRILKLNVEHSTHLAHLEAYRAL